MHSRTCATARRRTPASGLQRLPSLYSGSWKRFGLIAPSRSPSSSARSRSPFRFSTLSQGKCSATEGAIPVRRCTSAASSSFSKGSRGAPGCANTAKRVPEFPNAHDGVSTSCARSASSTRTTSSPRAASFSAIRSYSSVIASAPPSREPSGTGRRAHSRFRRPKTWMSAERRTTSRISASDPTSPNACICTRTLPSAAASTGPASTSRRVTFAVSLQRNAFCDPPPSTWTASIVRPVTSSICSSTSRYLQARLSKIARMSAGRSSGTSCPERAHAARIRAGMSPGASNSGRSGSKSEPLGAAAASAARSA